MKQIFLSYLGFILSMYGIAYVHTQFFGKWWLVPTVMMLIIMLILFLTSTSYFINKYFIEKDI